MAALSGVKPCILAFCLGSSWNGFLADNFLGLCSWINMEKVSLLWDADHQAPKLTWKSCPRALGWTWGALGPSCNPLSWIPKSFPNVSSSDTYQAAVKQWSQLNRSK